MAGKRGARHGVLQGLTQAKAAELLGLSVATISKWVRQGKLKTMPDGSIDPNGPELQGKAGKRVTRPGKVLDYYHERARFEHLKAEKLAFDIEVQKGRYVDAKAVRDTATGLYYMVGESLDAAVERLSSLIAARYGIQEPELRKMIGDHVFEARERLADEIEALADASA